MGLQPAPGQTHQEVGTYKFLPEMRLAVCVVARKLLKGLHYQRTGRIFPDHGCIISRWATNADTKHVGLGVELMGKHTDVPVWLLPVARNGRNLSDQFDCQFYHRDAVTLTHAKFGAAFNFMALGFESAGSGEAYYRESHGPGHEAWEVLQSSTLPTFDAR